MRMTADISTWSTPMIERTLSHRKRKWAQLRALEREARDKLDVVLAEMTRRELERLDVHE